MQWYGARELKFSPNGGVGGGVGTANTEQIAVAFAVIKDLAGCDNFSIFTGWPVIREKYTDCGIGNGRKVN